MSIKNKFLFFFFIIILAFVSTLTFLLFRTEDMIIKSLYNDFSQIANSTGKEVDRFLLERILSLETLSHNEGMKMQISGTDDTNRTITGRENNRKATATGEKNIGISPATSSGAITTGTGKIIIETLSETGSRNNSRTIVHKNIPVQKSSSGSIILSGSTEDTISLHPSIQKNELLQEILDDFIAINSTFHSVEFVSASGYTLAYTVEGKNNMTAEAYEKVILEKIGRDRREKPLFQEASTEDAPYYIEDAIREDDGNVTIDIAVPILLEKDEEKVFIGVIIGDIHMKHIWEITDNINIGASGEVMLYNKSGFTIADRFKEKILTRPTITVPSIQALGRGETGETIEISEMGTEAITAYTPLPGYGEYKGLGWGIQITQDTDEAFEGIKTFKLYVLFLMIAIILLVLFFVYLIHTRISNPLILLAGIAKEIGKGNYIVDMKDIIDSFYSRDEISLLAQTFGDMLLNLRININLMEQYKHTIDESSLVSKTDTRGIITYANQQFCETAQYQESELIGKSHNIVRHPDMPKEAFADLWGTISSKKIWKGIVKNRAKDGSAYWVTATVSPILDIDGNISEYISVRTDITELQNTKLQLAESFKKLQENTTALLEGQRRAREFELAKNIQDNFLPTVESSLIPGLDTYCVVYAATEIGGDMYDIIQSPSGDEYLFYIGDVTGHGLISGIIMAIVSSLIYTLHHETRGNIQQILQKLNDIVFVRVPQKMFVTMLFMKYIPSTKTFSYMGAGHERFLIYRKSSQEVETMPSGGIAVGMFKNMFKKDVSQEFKLETGDVLLLFTDGITEAQDAENTLFGINRLTESLKKHHENPSSVICEKIFTDIKDFTNSDIFIDDITMMAFRAE